MRSPRTSFEPLVLAALLAAFPSAAVPAPPAGEFRVAATVRVHAGGVLDREVREDARAVLAPASGGNVRVRLSARGKACELSARAGERGELTFARGQRCALALDEEEVRGHVDATLGSGTGRVQGDGLTLALSWDLAGTVSMRVGGQRVEVMGSEMTMPDGWAPEVPVRGTADTRGQGTRSGAR